MQRLRQVDPRCSDFGDHWLPARRQRTPSTGGRNGSCGLMPKVLSQLPLDAEAWVLDGNFVDAVDEVWARADCVIWLDYSWPVILLRLSLRNLRWWIGSGAAWNGQRMPLPVALSGLRHFIKQYPANSKNVSGFLSALAIRQSAGLHFAPSMRGLAEPPCLCGELEVAVDFRLASDALAQSLRGNETLQKVRYSWQDGPLPLGCRLFQGRRRPDLLRTGRGRNAGRRTPRRRRCRPSWRRAILLQRRRRNDPRFTSKRLAGSQAMRRGCLADVKEQGEASSEDRESRHAFRSKVPFTFGGVHNRLGAGATGRPTTSCWCKVETDTGITGVGRSASAMPAPTRCGPALHNDDRAAGDRPAMRATSRSCRCDLQQALHLVRPLRHHDLRRCPASTSRSGTSRARRPACRCIACWAARATAGCRPRREPARSTAIPEKGCRARTRHAVAEGYQPHQAARDRGSRGPAQQRDGSRPRRTDHGRHQLPVDARRGTSHGAEAPAVRPALAGGSRSSHPRTSRRLRPACGPRPASRWPPARTTARPSSSATCSRPTPSTMPSPASPEGRGRRPSS